jgi:predicted DNA-binding transcriptional regulator AlpA
MNIPATGWIRERTLLESRTIPYSRTKLRQEVAAGRFPRPHVFSPRVVAYDCAAVHAWIEAQRSERPQGAGIPVPRAPHGSRIIARAEDPKSEAP